MQVSSTFRSDQIALRYIIFDHSVQTRDAFNLHCKLHFIFVLIINMRILNVEYNRNNAYLFNYVPSANNFLTRKSIKRSTEHSRLITEFDFEVR